MTTYSVRAGDTLSAVASRFHTTVAALAKTNHLANPNLIMVGAKLQIPGSSFEPAKLGAPKKPVATLPTHAMPAAAPTKKRAIAGNATVAVIGDSHTAGTFGSALRDRLDTYLDKHGGKLRFFKGVPSSATSHWLSGGTTRAGSQTFSVPKLDAVLAKKPKVLVVALGTNQLGASQSWNESQIRAVMAKADKAGTKVVWVGPPNVRGFSGEWAGASAPERSFYDALRAVNAGRTAHGRAPITIINSRPETNENQTLDGVHYGGTAAKRWANGVFDEMVRPR